jgi:hypothetical protein
MSAVCTCTNPIIVMSPGSPVCERCGAWYMPEYGSIVPGSPEQEQRKRNQHKHVDKPERNGPCPCGSGLKFKRCCISFFGNISKQKQ